MKEIKINRKGARQKMAVVYLQQPVAGNMSTVVSVTSTAYTYTGIHTYITLHSSVCMYVRTAIPPLTLWAFMACYGSTFIYTGCFTTLGRNCRRCFPRFL